MQTFIREDLFFYLNFIKIVSIILTSQDTKLHTLLVPSLLIWERHSHYHIYLNTFEFHCEFVF